MTDDKVTMFMMANGKFFPNEKVMLVKERIEKLDDSKLIVLSSIEYKDPTTMLLISIFLGSLGIDRFMLGDTAMGVLKLLTGGLCGILTIIDWFTVTNKAKELNFNKFMQIA
jgi:TM2 domain-containing membrane protein YozV